MESINDLDKQECVTTVTIRFFFQLWKEIKKDSDL